jgi:NAD(P)-dependent dehydrogenase (short-subunit alcohol dehydrogenase family)
LPLAEWDRALRINLTGVFLVCRAVLPSMLRTGGGVIINVASQLGSVAIPNSAVYCATKGGVLQLTRALALDHAGDGVRVNSLSPGAVLTPRLTGLYGSGEKAEAELSPKHPIGRIGRPEEIAGAAVFLASSDATFMTGSDLVVDGGYLAQ